MKLFDLGGKVAIVTGGNGGIGRGIALGLAQAGADICIAARDAAKSERVRREIEALGRRCIAVRCDVDSVTDIDAAIDAARSAFGSIHILVNNAGRAVIKAPDAMTDEEWLSVIDTNLNGVFRFSRAVHPHLKSAGGGKIVNIGSMYSLFGSSLVPSYAASKGGVIQLTKSLAVAWAPDNIQVNALLPGWITTDMTAPVRGLTEMYQTIVSRTPAGRFGEPEECAGAAVFLASAASDFVTGQSLAVCGGYSIA
jgi:2-dehydro-3-deoxy-D-gluconate 5-dehydrogenase